MKNLIKNKRSSLISLLVMTMMVLVALVSFRTAYAAQFDLYIVPSSGTNITGDAGDTNLSSGNTNAHSSNNGRFDTLLSAAAPTANSTRMLDSYATSGTWYSLGRAYDTTGYGSDITISANATGKFYLRSEATTDRFKFVLRDYNPAAGGGINGAQIAESIEYTSASTSSTPKAFNISFGNAAYTLPAGHYVEVEIMFNPGGANRDGYVYCNDSNTADDSTAPQSRIRLEMRVNIVSSAGANGAISPSGTTSVDVGTSQSYTITANTGYTIQSLVVDGIAVPAAVGQPSYTHTFSNVTANHSITASFFVQEFTFNIAPGSGGGIDLGAPYPPILPYRWPGGSTYTYTFVGGTYPFTVTPEAGYGIDWVRVDGVDQGVPQGQTTTYSLSLDIATANTLSAGFLPFYTVTSSAGTGGTIDPAGATSVLSGQALTFDILPDNGYRILSITDNGVNVGNTSPYTVTSVTANRTIVATFTPVYTITSVAGPNGTISPIGDVIVDSGTDRNFTISPNFGFRVGDVLVDGVSIGAVNSHTFTNVTANHSISATFVESPPPNTYCAIPPFITTAVPPNVMLMLSVETPMQGAANPTVTCTGTPSSTSFACSSVSGGCNNGALGCYDNARTYYGYFESGKCYTYSGSGATGLFTPSAAATNHQCGGTAWSGNFLNWGTTLAVDAFRKAFTGGNRAVDTTTDTVILAARHQSSWFPDPVRIDSSELYTPYSGTRYLKRSGLGQGFAVCNASQTNCTVGTTGSGEAIWPTAGSNTEAVFSLRIKACDSTGGAETRCNSTNNKPEGTIQKYMDRMRFALMSYAADNNQNRDGGILRSRMKWVTSTVPFGLSYHDASGNIAVCATASGCANPEKEVNSDGTFVSNPDGASGANSGVINYINKFAYASGYKSYDPAAEMYYEVVRYFKNLTPSGSNYCNGLTSPNDGFSFYCDATKTNALGWRDPSIYSCSQNFVIAVNDANPWLDKRIPGSAFIGNYGGGAAGGTDWCGSSQGACDSDFLDGATQVNVLDWTNKVGNYEGITPANWTVGCIVNASGVCTNSYASGGRTENVTELGKVIGTAPGYGKENSYNMAGLAYYAHSTDLRPDLSGKNVVTTYMIDTQEPQSNMLVGPKNMLYLSAKFGGFDDKDGDAKPYKNASCGGVSSSPNPLCSEWDADNDGYPDTYFFASEASKVENGLNTAFNNMLNRAASGTAAAVANNKSGERGANMIQALFYPQWPQDKNVRWLGEVQALWYYLDPIINFSTIREDSDLDKELDLTKDLEPGNDPFDTKALWKAGVALHGRAASSRQVFTLLDSSVPDLTNSANAFTTVKRVTLKPLLNSSSLSDGQADTLIDYIRGVDNASYRSRTVTHGATSGVWKLGDVINSTPQVNSAIALNAYNQTYGDTSYSNYISTNQYKAKNIVYAGANDGMLHAFKLGLVEKIVDATKPFRIAGIDDATDIGKEEWGFIPNNALPYLPNQADSNYCHQYLVDGAPLVIDASINRHTDCIAGNYWDCARQTTISSGNLDAAKTSWKTVLLGSMGLGGASRDGNCNETLSPDADPANNMDCVKTPVGGSGFSSYFALDVTDPLLPRHMWELSDANLPSGDKGLGLTTPGPAIVRINAVSGSPARPDKTKNGRFFAVFASGPTGTIDTATRQFLGRSDQNLKIYIVDVNAFDTISTFTKCESVGAAGCNYWVIDTGKKFAFANSLSGASIDLDRSSSNIDGNYSDDAVYITYVKASLDSSSSPGPFPTAWDKGGVLRLVTNNNPDPATWFLSTLIDDIGPVATSIGKLQDRNSKKLWIYFGEGRYFYQGDELNTVRKFYGVADPCYSYDLSHSNSLSTSLANCPAVSVSDLKDQTSTPGDVLSSGQKGWFITMSSPTGTAGAERVVSDVTAAFNGIVFYTTYLPNSDICVAGGNTSLWAVKYSTGGTPPSGGMVGKAPVQTSSGGITMIDLKTAFDPSDGTTRGGRRLKSSLSLAGMAPKGRFPQLLQPKPVKQILNIQER